VRASGCVKHKLAYISSAWNGAFTVLVNHLVDERAQPSQGRTSAPLLIEANTEFLLDVSPRGASGELVPRKLSNSISGASRRIGNCIKEAIAVTIQGNNH
jgi:hypothetical protein